MYFACWRALSAPTRTTTTAMQSAVEILMSLQTNLKSKNASCCMFISLVWVYYDCIGCWCPHWPLMTVMQQPEPERELQPAERRPGSDHLDAATLGGERWDVTSSLIIHYGADTRRRHIHTISSGGLISDHVTQD